MIKMINANQVDAIAEDTVGESHNVKSFYRHALKYEAT